MEVSAIPAVASGTAPRADAAARPAADPAAKAGREFEAMMLGIMFEQMFEGVGTSGAFGGGQAERTWRSFMLQEYAKSLAETGGLGIAPMVEAEVARLYGAAGRGE